MDSNPFFVRSNELCKGRVAYILEGMSGFMLYELMGSRVGLMSFHVSSISKKRWEHGAMIV